MRRKALALGLATALSFAACSAERGNEADPTTHADGQEQVSEMTVRNILDVKIDMSSDPDMYNIRLKAGEFAAGATAVATCIDINENSPNSSAVFIENTDGDMGYVHIYTASTRDGDGEPQLTPGYGELKALPPCGDNPADA